MKFNKDDIQDMAFDDAPNGFEIMENEIYDHGRWDLRYSLVFKHDEKFYIHHWSKGATEQQDYNSFEFEKGPIECVEVRPVEVKTITYEEI